MKAIRQLFSLCLVIGMTIASYTVTFSPPVKGDPQLSYVFKPAYTIQKIPVPEVNSYPNTVLRQLHLALGMYISTTVSMYN